MSSWAPLEVTELFVWPVSEKYAYTPEPVFSHLHTAYGLLGFHMLEKSSMFDHTSCESRLNPLTSLMIFQKCSIILGPKLRHKILI